MVDTLVLQVVLRVVSAVYTCRDQSIAETPTPNLENDVYCLL